MSIEPSIQSSNHHPNHSNPSIHLHLSMQTKPAMRPNPLIKNTYNIRLRVSCQVDSNASQFSHPPIHPSIHLHNQDQTKPTKPTKSNQIKL
ncbi:hypothetical protein EYC80_002005 [Monilinia laxa]|uniref:Uncharacterized protein n=1 Tax=Monilinia laxa TaxID=61186 RepID=A0A5N6K6R5_MONLA|nr:hypothetical protein EYC80_002005 [Monilinia laxa]